VIVVDTSALMEIALDSPRAGECSSAMETADEIAVSAGTLAEALVVAGREGVGAEMTKLVQGFHMEVVPVTAATSRRVAAAYDRWGKGVHAARLNLGDCFAYALAEERGCPLLFVGGDFSRTDVASCL